jgi:RHS repeat-associated protein
VFRNGLSIQSKTIMSRSNEISDWRVMIVIRALYAISPRKARMAGLGKPPDKTTRILSLTMAMKMGMITGLQASVTEHQPPAPLPEFKTPAQLAKWRTETTAKTSAQEPPRLSTLDSLTPFYTGKPFLAESGSYAFKYREYNPEMGRWTTVDPSGFPDGANNRLYAAVPTSQLDPNGYFTISGITQPSPETATTTYNGHIFQVDAWTAIGITSTSFSSYNGWNFSNAGTLAGNVNITTYNAEQYGSALGAHIEISTSGFSEGNYDWIQRVNTTDPIPGQPNPKFDNYPPGLLSANSSPFYAGTKTTGLNPTFFDFSKRSSTSYDYLINNPSSRVTWAGTLYPVSVNSYTHNVNVYDGLQWGWTMKMIE